MADSHSEAVARAFTHQAAAFEDPRLNRLFTTDSEWLFERLPLTAEDLVEPLAGSDQDAGRRRGRDPRGARRRARWRPRHRVPPSRSEGGELHFVHTMASLIA